MPERPNKKRPTSREAGAPPPGRPYRGYSYMVVPVCVHAPDTATASERLDQVVDAVHEVVERFEWLGYAGGPRATLEALEETAIVVRALEQQERGRQARDN